MRVLWLSNVSIVNNDISKSGSWLVSMANELKKQSGITLFNITEASNVREPKQERDNNVLQCTLPCYRLRNGIPLESDIDVICDIINNFNPNIIHVWGVEKYWGLLKSRGYLEGYKCLLEMQGVLYSCYDYYRGNLFFLNCLDVLPLRKSVYVSLYSFLQHYKFRKRIRLENEIISSFDHISVQSQWTQNKVMALKENAFIYKSQINVRESFITAKKWTRPNMPSYITTVTSMESYKGLHVTLKAFSVIKKRKKDLKLKIVSGFIRSKLPHGYTMYIHNLIHQLGLENDVVFLGPLTADEMIPVLQNSSCNVISSFVESYSLVLAEAMALGVPNVVSYSGAMTEFAEDNVSALFYTPGDYVQCASKIEKIIDSEEISKALSLTGLKRDEGRGACDNQLQIYNNILSKTI